MNEVVSKVFNTELLHYLILQDNELIGYCAAHLLKEKFLTTIEMKPLYDIPYGGFISNGLYSDEQLIKLLPRKNRIKYIYSSGPIVDKKKTNEHANFTSKETAITDLTLPEDIIWKNAVNSKRRNMIRKAEKAGITAQIYNNEEGLKLFWPLLEQLHDYLGYNQLTYDYYKRVLDIYFQEKKAGVILAHNQNEILSGVIVIGNKNMMHYWKGASKTGIKNEGQGDLLQWEAIKYAKEYGSKFYDLCVIDKTNLPDIAKFKMGFSNLTVPFFTISIRSIYYKILNRVQNAL